MLIRATTLGFCKRMCLLVGAQHYANPFSGLSTNNAPSSRGEGFSYERRKVLGKLGCQPAQWLGLKLRAFRGELTFRGEPTRDVYFRLEDLEEAHLRLDMGDLPWPAKLAAASLDADFPMVLPLPGSTPILTRRLRLRTFYDYGRAIGIDQSFRAAGVGFQMPFGGDLSGVGSLTLTSVNLVSVLYSRAGDRVNRRPRLLFDLSGEL